MPPPRKKPKYLTPGNSDAIHSLSTKYLPFTASSTRQNISSTKGNLFDMVQGFVGDISRIKSRYSDPYSDPDKAALRLSLQPNGLKLHLNNMGHKILSDNLRRDTMTHSEQEDLHSRKLQFRNANEKQLRKKLELHEKNASDQEQTDLSMRRYDQELSRILDMPARFTPLRSSVTRKATKKEIDADIAASLAEDEPFISDLTKEQLDELLPRRGRGGKNTRHRRHKR